ncbi:hypothetical protein AAG570_009568, partial [Ranatra chinensis]
RIDLNDLNISDTLYCSFCNTGFLNQQQQRQHYKLDWHRYNLKQHLAQKKTVTEEKFAQLADDVSSISGSDSETDSETDHSNTDVDTKESMRINHLIARRSRLLFCNSVGQVISLQRCLLLNKKEEASSDEQLISSLKLLPNSCTWLIVMIGGGHFAAAIFKAGEPVVHKTFHSYTVRAKQGGGQSSKDNRGTFAKSAGASLRRHNEQSFTQHVQDVMKTWGPDIIRCDLIFYRAVGRGNSSTLFSGPNAPLLRIDPRIRTVPFTTRRPTFNEVKRVYNLLATVFIYDSNEMFCTKFSPKKVDKPKENVKNDERPGSRERNQRINRAKERPSPVRELPSIVQQLARESSDSESDEICCIEILNEEVSFIDDLKEFDDTVPVSMKQGNENRKKTQKNKKKEKPSESEVQISFWKSVHGACESGDFDQLKEVLEVSSEVVTKEESYAVLNQKNIDGQTILHKMALESKGEIVRLLLLHGGDPCIKDKKMQTPYDLCPDKNTRIVFRRFMGEFPDMYDYSKSHIPAPLTEAIEAEIAEKKRLSRKLKRQKGKERKVTHEAIRQEEEEKKRFLGLSDREKRALAAERRVLASSGKTKVVLSRCYLCADDMTGKVPFEYNSNRFCSMPCLKTHRMKSKQGT